MKFRFSASLAICIMVGACGNGADRESGLLSSLYDRLSTGNLNGTAAAAPSSSGPFTPEALAANPANYMVMNVPSVGLAAPAVLHTKNGQRETWQAQNGATFAFDNGILVATRGLMNDLLTASSNGVRAAIAAGGGQYQRGLESLDTQDQLLSSVVNCTVTSDGVEEVDLGLRRAALRKYTETCLNSAVSFQNAYWLDGQGQILQSRQFVSVAVGYIYANRL